jgi:hypothetical protein
MSNVFRNATQPLYDSPLILAVFMAALLSLLIGGTHLVEDTISSYYGYQQLVETFGVVPVTYAFTWFTLSIAPMVGQLIAGYMYLSDTTRKKWLLAWMGFFAIDFVSDLWHRTNNGDLIYKMWEASGDDVSHAVLSVFVAATFTFLAYTVGAEFFVIMGVGIIGESYLKAAEQLGELRAGIVNAKAKFSEAYNEAKNRVDASREAPAQRNQRNTTTRP